MTLWSDDTTLAPRISSSSNYLSDYTTICLYIDVYIHCMQPCELVQWHMLSMTRRDVQNNHLIA